MIRSAWRKFRDSMDFSGGFFRYIMNVSTNLTKKHELDAGLDIYSDEGWTLNPGDRHAFKTNIEVEILPGYVGVVFARSGMAVLHGIMVGAGVIDAPYRGEVKVLLFNMGQEPFTIHRGDRIAQLLTIPVNLGMYTATDSLSPTPRGDAGFGSSGR
jgi:dUTP pyrophosphatase